MTALKNYIKGLPNPVFLLDSSSEYILFSNDVASNELNLTNNSRVLVNDKLRFYEDSPGHQITQLNGIWYKTKKQKFDLPKASFQILELLDIEGIPNKEVIFNWKNLISVMLHRLRSPLTGVNGYIQMLEDEVKVESFQHRFDSIHKGMNNIYDIMDELEMLYNISPEYDDSDFSSISINALIHKVLLSFNDKDRKRFKIDESIKHAGPLETNGEVLTKIMAHLFQNALVHSTDNQVQISYSSINNGSISVINEVSSNTKSINTHIFNPFVTTRATNLGIGLTSALMYAFQIGSIILFNEEDNCVKFTLKFPFN
ncbi:sensor histidine kinase [Gracilimonas sp. Q87]|uniref:sensor histidine kinase n=1 Tax=Gracilimonas sp. Q87 TaxID=3384766 RepID=UPI00398407C8